MSREVAFLFIIALVVVNGVPLPVKQAKQKVTTVLCDCALRHSAPLLAVFDRVCYDCQSMLERNSLSLESCSANCFDNDAFKMCWTAIVLGGTDDEVQNG